MYITTLQYFLLNPVIQILTFSQQKPITLTASCYVCVFLSVSLCVCVGGLSLVFGGFLCLRVLAFLLLGLYAFLCFCASAFYG